MNASSYLNAWSLMKFVETACEQIGSQEAKLVCGRTCITRNVHVFLSFRNFSEGV